MTKTLCWHELSLGWFPFKLVGLLYFPVPGVSTWVFKFGTPGRLPMWVCAQKIFCPKGGVKIPKFLWPDRVLCTVLKCSCRSQSAHVRSCYVRIWSIFFSFFLAMIFPTPGVCAVWLKFSHVVLSDRSQNFSFMYGMWWSIFWNVLAWLLTFGCRRRYPFPKIAQMSPESP